MYWTSPNVLIISPDVLNIPDVLMAWYPPHSSWYPPMYSWYPLMYSWYPPMYSWYPRCTHDAPDVLNISRCTEHLPMYWTHIIQGGRSLQWGMTKLDPDLSSFNVKNEWEICRPPWKCLKRSKENFFGGLLGGLGDAPSEKTLKIMYPRLAKIAFHGISAVKIKCHLTIYWNHVSKVLRI